MESRTRKITLVLDEQLLLRLENHAIKTGYSLPTCVVQALHEYLDNWDDYYCTTEEFSEDDERPVFRVVGGEEDAA